MVDSLDVAYRIGKRRACEVVGLWRVYYHKSVKKDDRVLRRRIREIVAVRIRYGYLRIHVLLRREGWHVNYMRVRRIYCEEGLNLRHKRPRRHAAAAHRMERPEISSIDQLQVDNVIYKDFDRWAYENKVTLDFSRPGKPTDNALIESFNGSFRDECLNANWFLSVDDARKKVEAWRKAYNSFRPHSSLGNLPPEQFREQHFGGPKFPRLA